MTPAERIAEARRLALHVMVEGRVRQWDDGTFLWDWSYENGRPRTCLSCPFRGPEMPVKQAGLRECLAPCGTPNDYPRNDQSTCLPSLWSTLAREELARLQADRAELASVLPILSDRLALDAPEALQSAYRRGVADTISIARRQASIGSAQDSAALQVLIDIVNSEHGTFFPDVPRGGTGEAILVYNGVTINVSAIQRFDGPSIFAPGPRRYSIRVAGTHDHPGSAAQTRSFLMQPRCSLRFSNGHNSIQITPPDPTNGPEPIECQCGPGNFVIWEGTCTLTAD